jgi:hypothetical protein
MDVADSRSAAAWRTTARIRPARSDLGRIGLVAALALASVLLVPAITGLSPPPVSAAGRTSTAFVTTPCNPTSVSPSAIDIPLPEPGALLGAGSSLLVSFEVGVEHAGRSVAGRLVYVPSLSANFPVVGGGTVMVYQAPSTLTLTGANWSKPINETKTLATAENLSSLSEAALTSSKIAVMSNSTYGALSLEFRWSYVATPAGTSSVPRTSGWSIPNATASGAYLASIFFPATYVGLAGTSSQPATAGSVFVLTLTGAVVNTTFRIVVEYPSNGTETFSQWENTPVKAGPFYAKANLSFANSSPLPPANYLVHVHDHCEAIVHILTVTVVAAPHGEPTETPSARAAPR